MRTKMRKSQLICIAVLLVLPVVSSFAQDSTSAPPNSAPPTSAAPVPRGRFGRQGGCWQEAGIPPSVAQQGRQIMQNTRSQVMSACNDSSMSQQQKQEQVRQLHGQEREQIRGLLTEQQAEAYKACMEQHHGSGGGMGGGRNGGPCGEMPQPGSTSSGTSPRPNGQASPQQ